ncbi:MAG TPA: uroporphyrinogen decarboxylase [Dongiaceae bacterium]|jgi:uroporphyrinogen decarboxylase|nr:uroporphyrinogen decarboxylase [Dongiaceae bacterium]
MSVGTEAKKPLLRVLGGEMRSPSPLWLMRQAGRYLPEYRALRAKAASFLDFCFTPELAVEASLQPIRRFGFDGAILFSDILVVPHALGQSVRFAEGHGPLLQPIRSAGDVDRLSAEGLQDRLAPVFETLRHLSAALPPETTLIGFAGAPWTVASYMIEGAGGSDFLNARRMAYEAPDLFGRLIDLLVETTIGYLSAQILAGAEALQIFDSWSGALAERERRRWSLEPLTRITRRLKALHPEVPIILFPRGAGLLYGDFARQSGAAALSLDSGLPLDWAASELQPHLALQGNLDPVLLLTGGEALERETNRILATLGQGPFVFNLGHGILPETPIPHVERLVERIRQARS